MKKFLLTLLTITLMGTMLAPSIVNAKAAGKKQQTRWSIIECPVGEPNPVTSYKTLKKAEKVAGFSFHIPAIKIIGGQKLNCLIRKFLKLLIRIKRKMELLSEKQGEKRISAVIIANIQQLKNKR